MRPAAAPVATATGRWGSPSSACGSGPLHLSPHNFERSCLGAAAERPLAASRERSAPGPLTAWAEPPTCAARACARPRRRGARARRRQQGERELGERRRERERDESPPASHTGIGGWLVQRAAPPSLASEAMRGMRWLRRASAGARRRRSTAAARDSSSLAFRRRASRAVFASASRRRPALAVPLTERPRGRLSGRRRRVATSSPAACGARSAPAASLGRRGRGCGCCGVVARRPAEWAPRQLLRREPRAWLAPPSRAAAIVAAERRWPRPRRAPPDAAAQQRPRIDRRLRAAECGSWSRLGAVARTPRPSAIGALARPRVLLEAMREREGAASSVRRTGRGEPSARIDRRWTPRRAGPLGSAPRTRAPRPGAHRRRARVGGVVRGAPEPRPAYAERGGAVAGGVAARPSDAVDERSAEPERRLRQASVARGCRVAGVRRAGRRRRRRRDASAARARATSVTGGRSCASVRTSPSSAALAARAGLAALARGEVEACARVDGAVDRGRRAASLPRARGPAGRAPRRTARRRRRRPRRSRRRGASVRSSSPARHGCGVALPLAG